MNIDGLFMLYERLNCPVAVSVPAVLHEATCHQKSEPLSAISHLQRGSEVTLGKTGPELQAQADLTVFLYLVESTGKPGIRTQKGSYQKCLSASNKYGSAISYSFFFINALPFS